MMVATAGNIIRNLKPRFCFVNTAHVSRMEIFYAYSLSATKITRSPFSTPYSQSILGFDISKERNDNDKADKGEARITLAASSLSGARA